MCPIAPTLPEISDLIIRELFRANGKAHCEEMISRIALTGTTALHEVLSRSDVLEDLRKHVNDSYASFFCDTMVDETQEPRDKQALREEGCSRRCFCAWPKRSGPFPKSR